MQQKTKTIMWVAVPVIIIVAAITFLGVKNSGTNNLIQKLTNKSASTENQLNKKQTEENQNIPNGQNSASIENDQSTQDSLDEESPEEKKSSEKPDEALRQQIIVYINQNLEKLVAPPKNDQWDVPTFYFVGNSNVYLELYAVDTDLAGLKLLYKAERSKDGFKLTEIARYTEGEEDWILSQGKDEYSDYVMEEYDINEDNNKWEKTDEFSGADYSDEGNVSEETDEEIILP